MVPWPGFCNPSQNPGAAHPVEHELNRHRRQQHAQKPGDDLNSDTPQRAFDISGGQKKQKGTGNDRDHHRMYRDDMSDTAMLRVYQKDHRREGARPKLTRSQTISSSGQK